MHSTLAGLAVPLIFQPLNKIAATYYYGAQEGVMKVRDQKTHIITEALHGIRQIKFSAAESQWQKSIMAERDDELKVLQSVFIWAAFLTFAWLSMPILLSAAALGTYAWLNGGMSAAVAFTALSVFASLEQTLSVVANTLTEFIEARVSIKRIERYLDVQDMKKSTIPGEEVCFENVAIAWPSNRQKRDAFILRNISLRFPNGQLRYNSLKT